METEAGGDAGDGSRLWSFCQRRLAADDRVCLVLAGFSMPHPLQIDPVFLGFYFLKTQQFGSAGLRTSRSASDGDQASGLIPHWASKYEQSSEKAK